MKKKRRINVQKLFCFISVIFLLTCCVWYGGRLIYFYMQEHKPVSEAKLSFSKTLMTGNNKLKKVNGEYYFYDDASNNYVLYSNILFRIIKKTKNNRLVLISDEPITSLAYGTDVSINDSPIMNWLNESSSVSNSGIFEKNLNSPKDYLVTTNNCIDPIQNIKSLSCSMKNDSLVSLLSIEDYINVGSVNSFINNGYYTYLANKKDDQEVWLINNDGKLTTGDGSDIYGIKPVITLKGDIDLLSGDGTKDNPYKIETDTKYFGSYVKLGDDIWRVYDEESNLIKLSLNDYLKQDNEKLEYIYSKVNSFHNDTIYGSLAYYLNKTYLNSLPYKDLIVTNNYYNGYYNENNNYDYSTALEQKVDTKVGTLSIGDVFLNYKLNNYFIATGIYNKSEDVYFMDENGELDTIEVNEKANIIPTISMDKHKLTKGTGAINDPYVTE